MKCRNYFELLTNEEMVEEKYANFAIKLTKKKGLSYANY